MGKASEPKISDAKDSDFTCITFEPDLSKFKMEKLDRDIVDLFTRRAYDIAATSKGVRVVLNGKRLSVSIDIRQSVCWRAHILQGLGFNRFGYYFFPQSQDTHGNDLIKVTYENE